MTIREVDRQDLMPLLHLYRHLHDNPVPEIDDKMEALWNAMLADPNHHIIVGVEQGRILSSCVLIVVANLTRGQRPYGLVENVITHPEYRGRGYAGQVLAYAKEIAIANRCYKIMLMTGAKEEATLRFYERAGYNSEDKTAFIQWLPESV